ncbi:MAG: replicative DNA helicase [Synergistaceae bacterium]|nr:replicative DNA helicase [Synergistaceae bacterium]
MNNNISLPANSDAEQAVLGCCMLSHEALEISIEKLRPDDFLNNNNRIIFDVFSQMYSAGIPVEYITISEELNRRDVLNRVGGNSYIDQLAMGVQFTGNIAHYADIVKEASIRQKILTAGQRISRLALDQEKDIPAILEEAEKLLFDAGQNKSSDEFRHVKEIIPQVYRNIEARMHTTGKRLTGYPTGFTDLDEYTGGLQPGSLNIIAARPSMGKTALAMNIAQFGGGEANAPVLIFSLEMPKEQIVQRMISAESGVDLSRLLRGLIDTGEFEKVLEASNLLAQRNVYINDSTALSAMEFMGRCRRFKNRHQDLALIVVDYMQLMSSGEKRTEGRQQEVSDISRMLKATAREMNCPVVALSQLSREAEKRTDKQPQLSDLRDSGAIEQDADTVMLMFREDYYSKNETNDLTDSAAEIRVAKNRNGSTGVLKLTFKREITRFYNFGEI